MIFIKYFYFKPKVCNLAHSQKEKPCVAFSLTCIYSTWRQKSASDRLVV